MVSDGGEALEFRLINYDDLPNVLGEYDLPKRSKLRQVTIETAVTFLISYFFPILYSVHVHQKSCLIFGNTLRANFCYSISPYYQPMSLQDPGHSCLDQARRGLGAGCTSPGEPLARCSMGERTRIN